MLCAICISMFQGPSKEGDHHASLGDLGVRLSLPNGAPEVTQANNYVALSAISR